MTKTKWNFSQKTMTKTKSNLLSKLTLYGSQITSNLQTKMVYFKYVFNGIFLLANY